MQMGRSVPYALRPGVFCMPVRLLLSFPDFPVRFVIMAFFFRNPAQLEGNFMQIL